MSTNEDKARREALLDKDLQELFREETAAMDPNEGLERFMAAVAAERRNRASWWQRLNGWLGNIGVSPALASGVVLVQAGLIAALLVTQLPSARNGSPESIYRGAPGPVQQQADFKLIINPDAGFASLVSLLRANHCRIIAGPSELGELWVVADDRQDLEGIRKSLEASGLIDDVAVALP